MSNITHVSGGALTPELVTFPRTIEKIQPLDDSQVSEINAWNNEIIADPLRLNRIAEQISSLVSRSARQGNFILARSRDDVAEKLRSGMAALIPALDEDGNETFRYYRGMTPLVVDEYLAEFPVIEGGTLIANLEARKFKDSHIYRSSHVIQLANRLPALPENSLIINTSRAKASKKAGQRAGTVQLRREYFPMLDSLTCDPDCAPGEDGRIAGIGNVVITNCGDCIACPVNQAYGGERDNLSDSCGLYTINPNRAIEIEQRIAALFDNSATRARAVLVDGE